MKKIFPFLIFISVFTTACKIQPISVSSVSDVELSKLDPLKGTITLDLGMKINNPNKVAVTVYGVELDVILSGVSLGKVTMAEKVKIAKDTEQVYRVKADAQIRDILTNMPRILKAIANKKSDVELKGTIRAGIGLVKKKFEVDYKQKNVATQ
jgi:LEA14-like dessication related protein